MWGLGPGLLDHMAVGAAGGLWGADGMKNMSLQLGNRPGQAGEGADGCSWWV